MLLAPRLNCNDLTSSIALPLAPLGWLIPSRSTIVTTGKVIYLILACLNVACKFVTYVYASWPSPLMSLQFNDHDFPPLQWHFLLRAFGLLEFFKVISHWLHLSTHQCWRSQTHVIKFWKLLTPTCLNKVSIFKAILTGSERKVVLRPSGLSLIFPPIKPS
jgi:hypothetical protein